MHVDMEPALVTEPRLLGIRDELIAREPIFHRPEWGTSRADRERMTAPDFWEVGASGRRYSRDFVIAGADRPSLEPWIWRAEDFQCRELAAEVYLLTYTLIENDTRVTRRSTIWRRHGAAWQIVYHQGTIVADG